MSQSNAAVDQTEIEIIKEHIGNRHWRLNNLYKIRDETGKVIRFRMKPEQNHFYRNMHHRNNILKARKIGFTTENSIIQLDAAIFENRTCAMIADRLNTAHRLFREITRFAYTNLPDAIKQINPLVNDTGSELVFNNNGSCYVDVSFRGGTPQLLHISEFGKICAKYPEKAREIVTGAFASVPPDGVITIESTAEGQEGYFYDITQEAVRLHLAGGGLSKLDFKHFFYAWWQHPSYVMHYAEKGYQIPDRLFDYFDELEFKYKIKLTPQQKLWYAKTEKLLGHDMFREFPSHWAEAFRAVVIGAYYQHEFIELWRRGHIGNFKHDKSACVHTIWDIGFGDSTSIWFVQRAGNEWHIIDYFADSGHGMQYYLAELDRLRFEKGYRYGTHIGPHDLAVHEWANDGQSRLDTALKLGFRFQLAGPAEGPPPGWEDGIQAVRNVLPRCYFDEENCGTGLAGMQAYRREWDEKRGVWKSTALHNWASHPADSFRYFAVSLEKLVEGYTTTPVAQQQRPAPRIL